MLRLAREALVCAVRGEGPPVLGELPPILTDVGACFVTLTREGQLRGCIGNTEAREPLCRALIHNVSRSARHDYRFPPVGPAELESIKIQISLLSEPVPLTFTSPEELLSQLQAGVHGVVLRIGQQGATFLPQVWKSLPDKVQFLDHLSKKAGCSPSAWRSKESRVWVFHTLSFDSDDLELLDRQGG